MADFHLLVRPGRDAWLIAAMAGVLVDEGLVDRDWRVDETLVRAETRRIAAAASVAVFEDLGVQHDRDGEAVGLPAARRHPVREVRATFFNFDFPKNVFQLRRPVLDPPTGPLPEPEIHARLVDVLGFLDGDAIEQLRAAATRDRDDFAAAFAQAMTSDPKLATVAPVVLYRTLGETLPHGAAAAAALWPMAIRCSHRNPEGVARAGFGSGPDAGNHATAAATRAADVLGFTARIDLAAGVHTIRLTRSTDTALSRRRFLNRPSRRDHPHRRPGTQG